MNAPRRFAIVYAPETAVAASRYVVQQLKKN